MEVEGGWVDDMWLEPSCPSQSLVKVIGVTGRGRLGVLLDIHPQDRRPGPLVPSNGSPSQASIRKKEKHVYCSHNLEFQAWCQFSM